MTTAFYVLGEEAELTTVITDPVTGDLVDPTTVTLVITKPDATTDNVTPTRVSLGNYKGLYTPATAGRYTYAWIASGAVTGGELGSFDVGTAITQYCTQDDLLLGDLRISPDVDVDSYIRRAARDIDLALGRRYDTPIETTNAFTINLLRNVASDLASAYLIMAQAQGGEDNQVNAYGLFLYNRARAALDPYIASEFLPGTDPLGPGTDDSVGAAVSIVQEDAESLFAPFKRLTDPVTYPLLTGAWAYYYNDGPQ
jgi:hypothetical protein